MLSATGHTIYDLSSFQLSVSVSFLCSFLWCSSHQSELLTDQLCHINAYDRVDEGTTARVGIEDVAIALLYTYLE